VLTQPLPVAFPVTRRQSRHRLNGCLTLDDKDFVEIGMTVSASHSLSPFTTTIQAFTPSAASAQA